MQKKIGSSISDIKSIPPPNKLTLLTAECNIQYFHFDTEYDSQDSMNITCIPKELQKVYDIHYHNC